MKKMKKIFNKSLILALLTGFVFTSCEKELDQIPHDNYSLDIAFVTYNDFENGIRGVYSLLRSAATYGGSDGGCMLSAPDILADNVIIAQDGRRSKRQLYEYTFTSSTAPLSGLYQQFYELIYRANLLIYYADSYQGDNKAKVVAEAKALRAWAHMNLVGYWGKFPTQSGDANGSLGVAYMTEPDYLLDPARNTVGEVYSLIIEDLTAAVADLPSVGANERGRLNKEGAYVLLSRAYLYMGEWQNAVNAANNVNTAIANFDEVEGVWQDTNKSGVVFFIPNDISPEAGIGTTWSQFAPTSLRPEYVIAYDFYQLFSDDDARKNAYTFAGSNQGNNYNAIRKLLGRNGLFDGKVDWKLLRSEEALLNKAEALFNLGQEGPARAALDQLRDRRYTSYSGGETGNALRDAIRLERRLEFAFESHRFFDIKRWGLDLSRGNYGEYADGSGTTPVFTGMPAGDNKFQLPIALSAMQQNPNLVQNPGY